MKVQIQLQSLRLRVDEDELARLLDGGTVGNETRLPGGLRWSLQLALHNDEQALLLPQQAPLLLLPREQVQALQHRLPSRDGLSFDIGNNDAALQLRFDVDVRDSVRQRYGGKKPQSDRPSPD